MSKLHYVQFSKSCHYHFVQFVLVRPNLTNTDNQVTTVIEFGNTTLFCVVNSRPASIITWYKNDMRFTPDGNQVTGTNDTTAGEVSTTTSSLVFSNALRTDEGEYKCHATNGFGEDERTHQLNIHCKCSSYFYTLLKIFRGVCGRGRGEGGKGACTWRMEEQGEGKGDRK